MSSTSGLAICKLDLWTTLPRLNALQRWGNAHLNRGEYYRGLQVARRMLSLEPTSEAARRLEMVCLEGLTRQD
ncbi:TPA: tetratricopeptide repeat protein [Candidatus Poribacteria bacterium]|nr:tetratricopeptide repeat protein [Candidatus Poribacteria bacterium]